MLQFVTTILYLQTICTLYGQTQSLKNHTRSKICGFNLHPKAFRLRLLQQNSIQPENKHQRNNLEKNFL